MQLLLVVCFLLVQSVATTFNISLPTSRPTANATVAPAAKTTFAPSLPRPSTTPTLKPTGQPTGQPVSRPSGQPTGRPSRQPTHQPTGQPTRQPSTRPSRQPSARPTGLPTTRPTEKSATRELSCNQARNPCESNTNGTCGFFSSHLLIRCSPYRSTCRFSGKQVVIGPGAHLNVSGICQLTISATDGSFVMHEQAWIYASAVHVNATQNIVISGIIDVSGRSAAAPIDPPLRRLRLSLQLYAPI